MRTTLRLPKPLLERAKAAACEQGITLTALVERRLEMALLGGIHRPVPEEPIPICRAGGGYRPGLPLDSGSALLDQMDAWDAADRTPGQG